MTISVGNIATVKLSRIVKTPPYNVTVTIKENVTTIFNSLKKGGTYPMPALARLNGKLYPVGNMETLDAARLLKIKTLECTVEDAQTMGDVAKMHIVQSHSRTYNPVSVISMVESLEESGEEIEYIPAELRRIRRLNLNDDVKRKIDSFVKMMGEKRTEVPSIMHILQPIAAIDRKKQVKALNHIIEYSTFDGVFMPPDSKLLRSMLTRFRSYNSDGRTVTIQPEPDADDVTVEKGGNVEVDVRRSSPDMGHHISSRKDMINHTCKCKRKYIINLHNGTIKELKKHDDTTISAVETESGVIHSIPKDAVNFLDLDLSPVIYLYKMGNGSTGNSVLFSKKRVSNAARKKILGILK